MNYGGRFVTLYRIQESRPSPRKRNAEKQNGCLGRPYKYLRKEEKQKARRNKKAVLSDQFKEIEEKNGMGKTRDLFKKIRDTREHVMQTWA